MKRINKLVIVALAVLTVGVGFAYATSGFSSVIFRVMKYVTAGRFAYDGRFTAQSDGTVDLISGYNSSDSEVFTVDKDGDLTALTVASSGALSSVGFSDSKQVAVDQTDTYTDVIALDVDGSTTTGVDIINFGKGSTEYFSITSAGQVDVTNECTFGKGATMDGTTADPCEGAQYSPGSVFYNSTDGIMCYCDNNLTDLKIDGSSASCF